MEEVIFLTACHCHCPPLENLVGWRVFLNFDKPLIYFDGMGDKYLLVSELEMPFLMGKLPLFVFWLVFLLLHFVSLGLLRKTS